MHFLFEERRYWERSSTHTVVRERDPDFARLARSGTGAVRTYVHIWLVSGSSGPRYVGGLWARARTLDAIDRRRVMHNVIRHAGAADAGALLRRLGRHIAVFRRERCATQLC